MNRSTLIPDAAYERAEMVGEILGLPPGLAKWELEKLADGRFDSAWNLGIAISELALKNSGLTPMQYFMDRTRPIDEAPIASEDTVIGR